MSKAEGKQIAVKFTMPLLGDVTGNAAAFSVTGQEYQYINGPIINSDYQVESVSMYPNERVLTVDLSLGTLSDTQITPDGLKLGVV